MADVVRTGFDRFAECGPEAIRPFLDPDAETLAIDPGPWDCHGREEVIRFLHGFQGDGGVANVIEVTDYGDQVLLGLRRQRPDGEVVDGYSVISLRDGRVLRMQAYGPRAEALRALAEP